MTAVPDHFSEQAAAYRDFRPTYPDALFDWLAQVAPATALAWDCGCGNGQASAALARRFARVVATDASQRQLALAPPLPNVEYRCEPAEQSSLAAASADLVFVGQALHWFRHDAFYAEVRRVAVPSACLAAVTYNMLTIDPALDALIGRLYGDTLAGDWPAGREHVENCYRDLPFPFRRLAAPPLALTADWTLEQLLGYLESWSAVAAHRRRTGADPLAGYRAPMRDAWGNPQQRRHVAWPLTVLAGAVE
ncbi:MAG: class I SAM-dependent methyltransferase [Burkholderiaceae bacterium]